ncbi:50S ribosomal protein L10 [Candidatus Dependentiae bacterium]|nr:50S ribosomal protein L10 [Candidatus Dependentiae bacterium]
MNREQKAEVIGSLKKDFVENRAAFLVGVQSLTVAQMQTLRKELRTKGSFLRIAKARLMKIAVSEIPGAQELNPYFKEQVGLVFASDHFTEVAKVLTNFSKEHQALRLVVGYVETAVIPQEKIKVIAQLPSREVLLAQVCGTLKAPISNLVGVLNMQMTRVVMALKQIGEKKQ